MSKTNIQLERITAHATETAARLCVSGQLVACSDMLFVLVCGEPSGPGVKQAMGGG